MSPHPDLGNTAPLGKDPMTHLAKDPILGGHRLASEEVSRSEGSCWTRSKREAHGTLPKNRSRRLSVHAATTHAWKEQKHPATTILVSSPTSSVRPPVVVQHGEDEGWPGQKNRIWFLLYRQGHATRGMGTDTIYFNLYSVLSCFHLSVSWIIGPLRQRVQHFGPDLGPYGPPI